jgi:hypothetical protein
MIAVFSVNSNSQFLTSRISAARLFAFGSEHDSHFANLKMAYERRKNAPLERRKKRYQRRPGMLVARSIRSIIMSVSIYRATVPVFIRSLDVLVSLLDKAAAHAKEKGLSDTDVTSARLADDMLPFAAQIQRASDTSKASAERLSGVAAPRFDDTETTFAELRERIAKTTAYLKGIDAGTFKGGDTRVVTIKQKDIELKFSGAEYLFQFGLPNFYFHIVTAYDILRHLGVPVGKLDFLGPIQPA